MDRVSPIGVFEADPCLCSLTKFVGVYPAVLLDHCQTAAIGSELRFQPPPFPSHVDSPRLFVLRYPVHDTKRDEEFMERLSWGRLTAFTAVAGPAA